MSTPLSAPQLLTLRGLAKAIGVDAGQLSKESSRPGFPAHPAADGAPPLYDPAEVLAWRQTNVKRRGSSDPVTPPSARPPGPPPRAPSPPAGPADLSDDAELLTVLQSGRASPLEISRATVQITARRVARAHTKKELGPNDLDGLKKSLQELRTAESDYIDLEKQRRGLIARDEVRSIVAECCGRLVRVLGILENSISTEFSIWLADPKVAGMGADERARLVRDFVAKTTRAARTEEADEIERLINQPRE